jgi:NADH-quinone oxidoreductase subunit J
MLETILFYSLSFIMIAAALFVITRTNPIAAALGMVVALVSLAGIYGLLDAGIVAAVQILVYTGGILVLIIFVIMILNPKDQSVLELAPKKISVFLGLAGGVLLAAPIILIFLSRDIFVSESVSENMSDVFSLSNFLFANYMFPFEILSLLLFAAMTGAMVLTRRRL